MSATIKVYKSTDTGAPELKGDIGYMLALLDAVLVNGYNPKSADSITRSGSTATFTVAAGHGYIAGDVVLVSGAAQAEYNGEFIISNVSSTAFDYTVSGTPATPATGTITAKKAPLGFVKAYSGTNKGAYKSVDSGATGLYLRVDDTLQYYTRVVGYEAMTDVDTGTGAFPTSAQAASMLTWVKSTHYLTTAESWVLVGNGKTFYFLPNSFDSYPGSPPIYFFGDFSSYKAGDGFNCAIVGHTSGAPSYPTQGSEFPDATGLSSGQFIARSYTQVGSSQLFGKYGYRQCTQLSDGPVPYPSPVDNGLYCQALTLCERTSDYPRGVIPGVYQLLHPNPLNNLDTVSDIIGLTGRTLLMLQHRTTGSTAGKMAIDITGPW